MICHTDVMLPTSGIRLLVALAVVLCSTRTTSARLQDFPLANLTLASTRLPAGCALTPAPSERIGEHGLRAGLWAGLPIQSNPWSGADRMVVAAIQEQVFDPFPVPDAPPPTRREGARFRLRLAEDVEEAYAAVYSDGGTHLITVYAVRYTSASKMMPHRNVERERPRALRWTSGRTMLMVNGEDSPCFQAVTAHVREIAGR
jgi:hypothetical protein